MLDFSLLSYKPFPTLSPFWRNNMIFLGSEVIALLNAYIRAGASTPKILCSAVVGFYSI
jgi:hypothetical protein